MKRLTKLQIKFPRVAYTYDADQDAKRENHLAVFRLRKSYSGGSTVDRQVKAGHVRRR